MVDSSRRQSPWSLVFVVALAVGGTALAQEGEARAMTPEQMAMMQAYQKAGTPGPQHAAMAADAGTWDVAVKSWMDPAQPPEESTGTVTRSMILDGRVMVEQFQGSMMGQPFTGHGMQGYDNVSGKYWSTWNDSMTTGLMVGEGTCDETGTCEFSGTWNDPVTGGPVTARMVLRRTGADSQVFEMFGPGPDGSEMKMMEMTYTRR